MGSVAAVKKVVVLDYGSGNLRSAERALTRVGADVTVTADVGCGNQSALGHRLQRLQGRD